MAKIGSLLQTSASLKTRLQKAEAEVEIGLNRQHSLQLHLDSAASQNSALSQELESELQSNAELSTECKEQHSHCLQVCTITKQGDGVYSR